MAPLRRLLLMTLAFLYFGTISGQTDEEINEICNDAHLSVPIGQRCSACIQAHPKCAWCSNLAYERSGSRSLCSIRSRQEELCPSNYIVSPLSKVEVVQTDSTENPRPTIELAPQRYKMRLRPNETIRITIRLRKNVDRLATVSSDAARHTGNENITMVSTLNEEDGIDLQFMSLCQNGTTNNSNTCEGVIPGDTITFIVNITVVHCHTPEREFRFSIGPAGSSNNIAINLTKLCDCYCSRPDGIVRKSHFAHNPYHNAALTVSFYGYVRRSKQCSYRGDLICGLCQCPPPYAGNICECDTSFLPGSNYTTAKLDMLCRPGGRPDAPICGGRGVCICGQCICNKLPDVGKVIYGKYCDCDNFSCPRAYGAVCGGHGICQCNQQCSCDEGWTGRDCGCSTSTDTCLAANGKICSGNGHCICGRCVCNDDRHVGSKCEICPTCPAPCHQFRDCVLYMAFGRRPMNESEFKATCPPDMTIVRQLPDVHNNMSMSERCEFVDPADECTYFFKSSVSEFGNVTIFIQKDKECPPLLPVLSIILRPEVPCNVSELQAFIQSETGRARYMTEPSLMCRLNNDSTEPMCSGRGHCLCGKCYCETPVHHQLNGESRSVYGKYCECDDYSCPKANGKVCGGPSHGRCGCDKKCTCKDGWTGRDCSCPTSLATCRADNGKICNDKGVCICGICLCTDDSYSGPYCEECPTCPSRCVRFRDCVLYQAFNRRPMNESQFPVACPYSFRLVNDSLPQIYETCQFVDPENDCKYSFTFTYSGSGNATLWINPNKNCSRTP